MSIEKSLEHGGVSVFVIFVIPKYQGLDWWGGRRLYELYKA